MEGAGDVGGWDGWPEVMTTGSYWTLHDGDIIHTCTCSYINLWQ